jgi:transcriptional regulator with XRE-family HTH domain
LWLHSSACTSAYMGKKRDPLSAKSVVGERVREERKRQGMTQWTLAEIAELDRKHISMIETGQAEPRIGTLIRIAGALDVPVETLVAGLVYVPNEGSTSGHIELRTR